MHAFRVKWWVFLMGLGILLGFLIWAAFSLAPMSSLIAPRTSEAPLPTGQPFAPFSAAENDIFTERREQMVSRTIAARGIADPDVLGVMRTVPRHHFVPADYRDQAYADHPVPIGYGQTISQPFIVAWMTELLKLKPGEKVLEIGTGSGYQASVLAGLGYVDVYSIEIVPELADLAAERLETLGYGDVKLMQGDGYYGWDEHAPFDAIIVTAAPDHLPRPLVGQLVEGGRLVIPIGPPGGYQTLWRFVNEPEGLRAYNLGGVSFVPFTGGGMVDPDVVPIP